MERRGVKSRFVFFAVFVIFASFVVRPVLVAV